MATGLSEKEYILTFTGKLFMPLVGCTNLKFTREMIVQSEGQGKCSFRLGENIAARPFLIQSICGEKIFRDDR